MIELKPTKEKWPAKGEYLCTNASVHVRCMGPCGKLFCLDDHSIDAEGYVNPSVVCPTGDKTRNTYLRDEGKPLEDICGWHVFIKLLDWKEKNILR